MPTTHDHIHDQIHDDNSSEEGMSRTLLLQAAIFGAVVVLLIIGSLFDII